MIRVLWGLAIGVILWAAPTQTSADTMTLEGVEKDAIMRRGELAEILGARSGPSTEYPVPTASERVGCGVNDIHRIPISGFGHVNIQRNRSGLIMLVGMTPPPSSYGRFDIVDAGLPEGFFGLMPATGGDFFWVIEVLGWDSGMPINSYRKSAVAFRDGNEVMEACFNDR